MGERRLGKAAPGWVRAAAWRLCWAGLGVAVLAGVLAAEVGEAHAGRGADPRVGGQSVAAAAIASRAGADEAVAYQLNGAHDGEQAVDPLRPPLRVRWTRSFADSVSYPLIAQGEVFVVAGTRSVAAPLQLVALNARTGAQRWMLPLPGYPSYASIAYDAGTVFVENYDGQILALDASSGRERWSTQLASGAALQSTPVADRGVVYINGPGLYAVQERTGRVLWHRNFADAISGGRSSPIVEGQTVHVTFECGLAYALDRITGRVRWHAPGSCAGLSNQTGAVHNGLLWDRNEAGPEDVFAARTGALVGHFDLSLIPAFAGRLGFFLSASIPSDAPNQTLSARSISTGSVLWRFRGDGELNTPPITVGPYVYTASSTAHLYALHASSGGVAWSTTLAAGTGFPDEHDRSLLPGLAAGEGLLVVPEGNDLQAFAPMRHAHHR
jgi:outer membrane protein assembly factor BamB